MALDDAINYLRETGGYGRDKNFLDELWRDEGWKAYKSQVDKYREEEKVKTLELGLKAGKSLEDIAVDTGIDIEEIKSYTNETRPNYGVKPTNVQKAGKVASFVANELLPTGRFSKGIVSAVTADEEQARIAEGQEISRRAFENYTKQYRQGKISKDRYNLLVRNLARDDKALQEESARIMEESDPTKFTAAAVELGAMPLIGQAQRISGAAKAAEGLQTGRMAKRATEVSNKAIDIATAAKLEALEGGLYGTIAGVREEGLTEEVLGGTLAGSLLGGAGGTVFAKMHNKDIINKARQVAAEKVRAQAVEEAATTTTSKTAMRNAKKTVQRVTAGDAKVNNKLKAEAAMPGESVSPFTPEAEPVRLRRIAFDEKKGMQVRKDGPKLADEETVSGVRYVPIKNIRNSPQQDLVSEEAVGRYIETIDKGKPIKPILVRLDRPDSFLYEQMYKTPDDIEFTIIDGNHRMEAAGRSGYGEVPVKIVYDKEYVEPGDHAKVDDLINNLFEAPDAPVKAVPKMPGQTTSVPSAAQAGAERTRAAARTALRKTGAKKIQGDTREFVREMQERGWDPKATPNINLGSQAENAFAIIDEDFDTAYKMALGELPVTADTGTSSSVMYEAIQKRILANESIPIEEALALNRRLALESTVPQLGKEAGQFSAGFAIRDADNPMTIIKQIEDDMKKYKVVGAVTDDEAKALYTQYRKLVNKKSKIERMKRGTAGYKAAKEDYAWEKVAFDKMADELKQSKQAGFRDLIKAGDINKAGMRGLESTFGLAKSLKTTFDMSALGRQGFPALMTHPTVWAKNTLKQFKDWGKALGKGGESVIDISNADMIARDLAINGTYRRAGLKVYGAMDNFWEEQFPKSFLKAKNKIGGKVPVHPMQAAEAAFTAFQQRNRADMFDMLYEQALDAHIDVTDDTFLKALGNRVNTLTRAGSVPKQLGADAQKFLNLTFFSPQMFFSNFGLLGGHVLTGGAGRAGTVLSKELNFIRKESAKDLIKMAVASASALVAANAATGGKVELDPRSSDFGKIRIGDTRFDLTGGLTGIVTLGMRMLTQSTKSSATGEIIKLNDPDDPDGKTISEVVGQYAENKLSPAAGVIWDLAQGKDFDGKRPTAASTLKNAFAPLIWDNVHSAAQEKNAANTFAVALAEFFGVSTNTYGLGSPLMTSKAQSADHLKKNLSKERFAEASEEFDEQFRQRYEALAGDDRFWKLTADQRSRQVQNLRAALIEGITAKYGVKKYESRKPTSEEEQIMRELEKYRK